MPEVFDWQDGDPRAALQRAVQELVAGRLVILPTDTGYHLAALALNPEALTSLGAFGSPEKAFLGVRGVADALRWAPWMGETATRLGRRCWPGPVTLIVEQTDGTASPADTIRLRVPAHEAPLTALDYVEGPLAFLPLPAGWAPQESLVQEMGDRVSMVIADHAGVGNKAATTVTVRGNSWAVSETGHVTEETLRQLMPTTLLFVCTGNTCRSPLAEALCKKLLADRLGCSPQELATRGFQVLSAGLAASVGADPTAEAVAVATDLGADLAGHRSQPLTAELLARADYLFAMTQGHLRAIQPYCDASGPRLSLLASDGGDIRDPIGGDSAIYRECAEQILRHLQDCLARIEPL